jgi:hypothetical protein
MDVYKVQQDGNEELLLSGVSRAEIDEVREWFSNTKPLGPGISLVVKQSSEAPYRLTSAGAEPSR